MFIGLTFTEDQSQNTFQTYSEDSLENGSIKSRQHENNNHPKSNTRAGSIILAGHLAGEHSISLPDYEKACKNIRSLSKDINMSDETSYLSVNPDLNKCINLFQDECASKENSEVLSNLPTGNKDNIDTPHSNKNKTVEVQCNLSKDYSRSISLNVLRNVSYPCNEIRRSKSCTILTDNLNKDTTTVKTDQPLSNRETATDTNQEKIHIIISPCKTLLISRCSTSLNKTESHSIKEDQKCDSISSERSSKELNPSELRALLNSLDQKSWREEGTIQKHLLRRMSANFYDSPKNFTEQLLTIIEESFINNDTCGPLEYPDISLCRLTEELRKMCKFIEDETVPEWPRSPSTSISNKRRSSKECRESKPDSSKSHGTTSNLYTTTLTCNIKSPKKIYRHMTKINVQSPKLHDSTSTFESLEAFCKTLYPNEYRTPPGKKDKSQSPIRDMKYILLTCENQMASLDNSPNIREQLRKAGNLDCAHKSNTVPETQVLRDKSSSHGKRDQVGSKSISHVLKCKQQVESSGKPCKMIDPDELENTLMYELAKKRQRCLETAKVISEIDASSESASSKAVEAQQSCSSNVNIESNINDSKFMETLMTVKRYQNYLEEYKPLLNVLQQTESSISQSSCNKKDTRFKKTDKIRSEASKSPMMRKKVTTPVAKCCPPSNNNAVTPKPRLFVTPGKAVTRTCNSKRTYFPNLISATNKQKGRDISPHEKKVYRQMGSYDHVISPVGMYIKSTNPSLVKNLRPKTDEMLLTPRKKQTISSASPKPKMKFRLSPNEKTEVRGQVFMQGRCR
jgi:hypothetical protein